MYGIDPRCISGRAAMPPKVCVNKLKREMKDFISSPPPSIPAIYVNERNMLGACCCGRCCRLLPAFHVL